jgi:oxalate decarboxylase/phosphoglucose isomerase-like protein (cupin superfamily)
LTEGTFHDLHNTGSEDLRVVAVFAAPKVQQHWSKEVWQPGNLKVTGSPNS